MAGYTRVCLERSVAAAAATSPAERTAAGAALRVSVEAALAAADVLVVPTMGALSLAAGEDYDERPLVVDGRPLEHFCDAALTPPFNAAGACPVVAVPSGAVGAHGVPIGVQVVARAGDERTALRAAAALERERPGGRPPLEALAAASASPSGGG
jgi:Asp-tRNA(Asn)/Glu-tRNA(Gln) amidotransferase A subunit family amidase